MPGRTSGIKMVGMAEKRAPGSLDGGSPSGLLVHLPALSFFCTRKSRRWQNVPSDSNLYIGNLHSLSRWSFLPLRLGATVTMSAVGDFLTVSGALLLYQHLDDIIRISISGSGEEWKIGCCC